MDENQKMEIAQFIDCGNKIAAVQKVLDAANYIQENQNSIDMQLPKSMLFKIAEIMILTIKHPIDQFVHQQTGGQIPMPTAERQTEQGHECQCEGGCDGHAGEQNVPEFNIAETIAKIQKEVQNEK